MVWIKEQEELFIVPELKELCLQIFSRIFSGEGLTDDQVQMFYDYNTALLSLSTKSKQYQRGMECLECLSSQMLRRFHIMEQTAKSSDDGKSSPVQYVYSVFQNQKGYVDVQN